MSKELLDDHHIEPKEPFFSFDFDWNLSISLRIILGLHIVLFIAVSYGCFQLQQLNRLTYILPENFSFKVQVWIHLILYTLLGFYYVLKAPKDDLNLLSNIFYFLYYFFFLNIVFFLYYLLILFLLSLPFLLIGYLFSLDFNELLSHQVKWYGIGLVGVLSAPYFLGKNIQAY